VFPRPDLSRLQEATTAESFRLAEKRHAGQAGPVSPFYATGTRRSRCHVGDAITQAGKASQMAIPDDNGIRSNELITRLVEHAGQSLAAGRPRVDRTNLSSDASLLLFYVPAVINGITGSAMNNRDLPAPLLLSAQPRRREESRPRQKRRIAYSCNSCNQLG